VEAAFAAGTQKKRHDEAKDDGVRICRICFSLKKDASVCPTGLLAGGADTP
jgi:hypothetical protein